VKLTHVRLLVTDFAAALGFYRDTLGLACTYGDESGPYADFDAGDASLAIFTRKHQAESVQLREAGDGALVVLQVDDVDETAARLKLAEPISRPDWGIRVAYVRDPSGNLLELYSGIPMDE
jgi:catechol 2,3-dioxygenase-like lactoylglutathione lyase family enzyme